MKLYLANFYVAINDTEHCYAVEYEAESMDEAIQIADESGYEFLGEKQDALTYLLTGGATIH